MPNPISEKTRNVLYVTGMSVGILSTAAGPLMVALAVPEVWVAVVLSLIGAVTTLLSTLARANLTSEDTPADAPLTWAEYEAHPDDPTGRLTD